MEVAAYSNYVTWFLRLILVVFCISSTSASSNATALVENRFCQFLRDRFCNKTLPAVPVSAKKGNDASVTLTCVGGFMIQKSSIIAEANGQIEWKIDTVSANMKISYDKWGFLLKHPQTHTFKLSFSPVHTMCTILNGPGEELYCSPSQVTAIVFPESDKNKVSEPVPLERGHKDLPIPVFNVIETLMRHAVNKQGTWGAVQVSGFAGLALEQYSRETIEEFNP